MADIRPQIKELNNEGSTLDDFRRSELTIAFLSLRSALKSWFSTYHFFRWKLCFQIQPFASISSKPTSKENLNRLYNSPINYFEAYSEIIIYFHHYFELIIKDILRREHELLVIDAQRYPPLLYKLLKGEEVTPVEIQNLPSIEFSVALDRLSLFIKSNKLDQAKYGFLAGNGKVVLEELNKLRNRLIHRGTFVLPYRVLDDLIGKYILPLVSASLKLPEYSEREEIWKYGFLDCSVDPFTEILIRFSNERVSYECIALLKELGRAAYQNPISKGSKKMARNFGHRERSEAFASLDYEQGFSAVALDIKKCPVCGSKSLVRYYYITSEDPSDPECPDKLVTDYIQCYCCTFEINSEIPNASELDIPIDDYWFESKVDNN